MSTNQQPVSKVPSTAPVTNGDSKVPISKPLSQQPKKSDSEVEDEEEGEVEYEEEEVEVDEEYDEDYEIEEVEVDDDGEEDLEEPTEADAEELEDDDVTNDEFDRVGSKIDELLAKTGTLQSSLNGSASLASKAIAETATKPEPAKIPEISAVKIVQSPVKPAEVVKVEEVEDEEEEVEYVYEDEEEEEEPEKVPGKIETKQETKTETKPEEEPVKVVPQIVFKPKVPEKVLEEEEEEELEDEEVEYVYEDEEEEEEEAPPAGNLLRHASNNWNICDLKDDAEICLQTQDGSFNNKVVEAMPISELDQSKSKQPELNQSELKQPESSQPISNVSRPLVIQSEEEEEEEDIEEIEIALEEGMEEEEEEDDDDEVDEQMPDNLLRDPSSSINKALHWAAAENQTDAIGELLDRNIDVHLKTTNPEAMTASELAAMKKNFEVAEALGEMEQEDLIAKQQQQQQQQRQSKPEPKSDSVCGSSVDDDEQQFKLKQDKIDSIISQAFESAGNRFTKIQEEDEDEVEAEAEAEEVEVKVKLEQKQEIKESEQCKMEQISQSSSQPEQSPLTNNNISEFKEQEEEVLNRPRFSAKLESDHMSDIVAQLELPPESDALWCRDSIQLDQSPISSPSFFATTTGHLVLTCILFVLLKFLYSKLFSQSVTDAK